MARNRKRNNTKNSYMSINSKSPKTKYGLIPVNELTYGNPNAA